MGKIIAFSWLWKEIKSSETKNKMWKKIKSPESIWESNNNNTFIGNLIVKNNANKEEDSKADNKKK